METDDIGRGGLWHFSADLLFLQGGRVMMVEGEMDVGMNMNVIFI